MESRKKLIATIVTVLFLVIGPFIFLGTGMMTSCYQKKIDETFKQDEKNESAREWELRLGKICDWTWRPLVANQFFKKFIDRYPKDPRRPDIMYRRATNFKEAQMNPEARAAFKEIVATYPDTPEAKSSDDLLTNYYKDYER